MRGSSTKATTANGTPTKKHQRQPSQLVSTMQATQQRAADRRDGHHGAELAGVPAALPRADHRRHRDLHQRLQAAEAQALEHPPGDELVSARLRRPASIEPTMKMTIESWISSFLLNRSASLPQIGVEAVEASRVAVTTQVY